MIYRIINCLLIFLLSIGTIFNKKLKSFFKKRIGQNYGLLRNEKNQVEGKIWLHCSSVGEINLSQPLIEELLNKREEGILISVFTDTGYETALGKYKDNKKIKVIYFPLDSYKEIKKILKNIKLELLIIVETEIWPNLIRLCSKSKIILINGRISEKSFPKYKKIKFLINKSLILIDSFLMQSQDDAEKIIRLGVRKEKVQVVGNMKFAINFPKYTLDENKELIEKIGANGRKIIVLGSTREFEEDKILSGIDNMKKYLFVIIPRHLTRLEYIEKLLEDKKITYVKYSQLSEFEKNKENRDVDVILIDTMGVQRRFYSIADIVFVGGTLVNVGGHSLLEPLYYGKTPIYGKYIQNVKDIAKELELRNLGYKIENMVDFKIAMENILKSERQDEKIETLFKENKEVLNKTLEKIENLI